MTRPNAKSFLAVQKVERLKGSIVIQEGFALSHGHHMGNTQAEIFLDEGYLIDHFP